MLEEHFWNLFAKKLTGEASARKLAELEQLLRTYPELMYSAEILENFWRSKSQHHNAGSHEAFEQHMARIHTRQLKANWESDADPSPVRRIRWKRLAVAAAFVLFCGGGWWLYRASVPVPRVHSQAQTRQVQTTPGSKTKIILPDSSVVWLNSGSRISYDEGFGHGNRNLTLTGEAFFDVRKDVVPFIIKTSDLQIRVLGTAFNVRAYPNERKTETSLIRGRVEITWNGRPDERIVLKPREKLTVLSERDSIRQPKQRTEPLIELKKLEVGADSVLLETQWMQSKLEFRSETFEELAARMENWFGVQIVFKDPALRKRRFTGVFRNESIAQALEALQYSGDFRFEITDNVVTIRSK